MDARRGNVHLFPMLPFVLVRNELGEDLMDGAVGEDARDRCSPAGIPIVEHLEKKRTEQ